MAQDVDAMLAAFEAALPQGPDRALGLVTLAETAAKQGRKAVATRLAREGVALAGGDARVLMRGRGVLHALIPGYHAPMMNDVRRNQAWDRALRSAIKPGMHVFEIGTGAGMLALMAARAGAEHVVTCEIDPIVADLARDLVAVNGYADRVTVLTGSSLDVKLERKADLLFCDIFGDKLFDFNPLALVADARARLLAPGAVTVPGRVSLNLALARWADFDRQGKLDSAAGFDLSPMRDFVLARKTLSIQDPDVDLVSSPQVLFSFDLARDDLAAAGEAEVWCEAERASHVHGLLRWIRLQLDETTALEPRPDAATPVKFFSATSLALLPEPRRVEAGERVRVRAAYAGKTLETWLAD